MKDTKNEIAERALNLFNEKGIEYVGMREIAAAMNTRIGNITYYFPTKDDLVFFIGTAYQQANTIIRSDFPVASIAGLLALFESLFTNQVRYRCLLLSFVHIMEHNVAAAKAYKSVRSERAASNESAVRALAEGKFLKADSVEISTLGSALNIVGRFWLSEAILSGHHRSKLESQIPRYLIFLANLLKPYATAKGLREIEAFLAVKKF